MIDSYTVLITVSVNGQQLRPGLDCCSVFYIAALQTSMLMPEQLTHILYAVSSLSGRIFCLFSYRNLLNLIVFFDKLGDHSSELKK